MVSIHQANLIENEFCGQEDMKSPAKLRREQVLVSSMTISKIILTNYELDLIEKLEWAGRGAQEWCKKKVMLGRRIRQEQEAVNNWQLKDGMLYIKNSLYIRNNNELNIMMVNGCHDSQLAGHF